MSPEVEFLLLGLAILIINKKFIIIIIHLKIFLIIRQNNVDSHDKLESVSQYYH